MALIRYLMEGGSEGAIATETNSGASLIFPSDGDIVFSSAQGRNGRGIRFVSQPGGQCEARWNASASNTTMAFRGWFFAPNITPTETIALCNLRHASGVAVRVQWTTANDAILVPVSGSTVTLATSLTPGAQYDISIRVTVGNPGTLNVVLRTTAGTTVGSVSTSSFNSGTSAITSAAFGLIGSYIQSYTSGWDEISFDDGSTSEIPLYTPPAASPSGTFDLVWTGVVWK